MIIVTCLWLSRWGCPRGARRHTRRRHLPRAARRHRAPGSAAFFEERNRALIVGNAPPPSSPPPPPPRNPPRRPAPAPDARCRLILPPIRYSMIAAGQTATARRGADAKPAKEAQGRADRPRGVHPFRLRGN